MAITRLQLPREMYAEGELVAGAAPIKYEGDMRPEAQTASYGFDDAMGEARQAYEDYKKRGIIPPTLTFEEFLEASQEGGFFEMADGGSIRQNYGLGSMVKKIGKGIKKLADNPYVQTALMMNPATAPYAMAYSGARSLKQGNPMGALMAYQGISNTGWGQNQGMPKFMNSCDAINNEGTNIFGIKTDGTLGGHGGGGAGGRKGTGMDLSQYVHRVADNKPDPSKWDKALNFLFKSKNKQDEYDWNPLKVGTGAMLGLGAIGMAQKAANAKQPKIEDMIGDRGSKIGLDDIQIKVQAAIDSGDKETYENLKVTENLAFLPPWESIKKADGGRIGYDQGGITGMLEKNPEFLEDFVRINKDKLYENQKLLENKEVVNTLLQSILDKNQDQYPNTPEGQQKMYQDAIIEVRETIQGFNYADGGRIGYAAGGQTSAEMLQMIEKLRAEGKTELEIQQILKQMFQNRMSMPGQGIMSQGQSGPASFIDTVITETGAGGEMPRTTDIASIRENSPIMQAASAKMSNVRPEMMGGMRGAKMADPRLNQINRFYKDMAQPQENQRPVPEISPYQAADGGRIGYAIGDVVEEVEQRDQMKEIEGQTAGPQWYQDRLDHLMFLGYSYDEAGAIAYDSDAYYNIVGHDPFAQGGRAGAADGGRIGAQEGGLMSLGGNGMDLRGRGFVPIGAQEKADDVPARLSKNEFVFTADAVRAAGGGDVDQGADKMYKTMKQLENRVA